MTISTTKMRKLLFVLFALCFVTMASAEENEEMEDALQALVNLPEEADDAELESEDDEELEDEPEDDEEDEDEEDDEDGEDEEQDPGNYRPSHGGHGYGGKRYGPTLRALLNSKNIRDRLAIERNLRKLTATCTCSVRNDKRDRKVVVYKGKHCSSYGYQYGRGYRGVKSYGGYTGYGHKGYHRGLRHGLHHPCKKEILNIRRPRLSCNCKTQERFVDLADLINAAVKRAATGLGHHGLRHRHGYHHGHGLRHGHGYGPHGGKPRYY